MKTFLKFLEVFLWTCWWLVYLAGLMLFFVHPANVDTIASGLMYMAFFICVFLPMFIPITMATVHDEGAENPLYGCDINRFKARFGMNVVFGVVAIVTTYVAILGHMQNEPVVAVLCGFIAFASYASILAGRYFGYMVIRDNGGSNSPW